VLDLFFLISAYGADLIAEMLLGRALQVFHDTPVVPAPRIRALLAAQATPEKLRDSTLGNQVRELTITLDPLGFDDLTKLWSAFQMSMNISAAIQVTAVVIESDIWPVSVSPPRGFSLTALPLDRPEIMAIAGPDDTATVAPGESLRVDGRGLITETTTTRID